MQFDSALRSHRKALAKREKVLGEKRLGLRKFQKRKFMCVSSTTNRTENNEPEVDRL